MSERLSYTFEVFGHPNIRATHFKTIEFNKDSTLTERGDCICGINASFEKSKLKRFSGKVKMICTVNGLEISEFKFIVNDQFDSDHELVLRKSKFNSPRTFGFFLNRGSNRLSREIVEKLKDPNQIMKVELLEGWY